LTFSEAGGVHLSVRTTDRAGAFLSVRRKDEFQKGVDPGADRARFHGPESNRPMTGFRTEVAKGWGVLVASAAGFGLGMSGLPYYTSGVFVEPLNKAFGWSATQVQGGLTVELLANMASLPLAAWLAKRFGPRRVAIGSVALFSLSYMAMAFTNSALWAFYLHWMEISLVGAGTLTVIWTQVISGWFVKGRGAALACAMLGSGLTALFAPVLANSLIVGLGWRLAYAGLGALPLLVALPLIYILLHERAGEGAGAGADSAPPGRLDPAPMFGDWRFWLIGFAFLLVGAAVSGVIPNLVKLLRFHGFSRYAAAGSASLLGLFVVVGRLGCGPLLDRVWVSAVAAVIFTLAGLSTLLLRGAAFDAFTVAIAAAAVGLAAGAELDILPYIASRYFGVARVGAALAGLSGFFYCGSALGPWGFSWLVDAAKGYDLPLALAAGMMCLSGASLLLLGRYRATD
jgi:MFS family permease